MTKEVERAVAEDDVLAGEITTSLKEIATLALQFVQVGT